MMKLGRVIPYLKKIQKIFQSRDIPPEFCWHQKFCYIKKYKYKLHFDPKFLILLTFPETLKIILINVVIILIMSAKIATPAFLKIMEFWNKGYDAIIPVDGVTNKVSSRDSNYIVGLLMWPKFGNCSISMREVITTLIYKDLTRKTTFLRDSLGWSSIIWDLH